MRRRATKIVTTVIAAIAIAAGCTLGPMAGIATACIVMSLLSAFALYRSSRSRLPYRAQAATAPNPPLPASDTPCPTEEPAQEPITCQELEEQEEPEEQEEQEEDDVEPMADGEDVEEEPDATEDAYDFSAFATDLLLSKQPIDLLKKTVDQIREREDAGGPHAPCGLEQYLARRLEEAGLYSTRENEKLPVLSVARPRHSGLFYLRTSARQVTFGAQLRIVRIEAALNATLLASLHAPRAGQSSMEELYKYTQRFERSMCAQVPNVDMADWSYLAMPWQMRYGPTTQGEWSVRQTIAEAIESLQTPHRLEASFRSNVSAGDVGIEIFVTPSQAYWKSALVDGLGVVPITNEMRAKNASEYAARLAILLANHAFRTSNRIKRVWVSGIEHTPSSRICRYSVCFDRRAFSLLRMEAVLDPIAILRSFGASLEEESGRLLPTSPLFYLEDERFCPPKRHDLWQLSERPLSAAAAVSLGTTRVSGLSIHEELPRLLASEQLLRRLDDQDDTHSTEKSVQAVLSVSQETSDFSVLSAAERIMQKLVDGSLDPKDTRAIQDEFVSGDQLTRSVQRAQRLLTSRKPDEALECLLQCLGNTHGQDSYSDTASVAYRSFETFTQRSLYNRMHVNDKRTVVLVPDAYVVAQLLIAALYMNMPEEHPESRNALERARDHAQKALDVAPLSTPAHLSVAACLERSGNLDLASEQVAKLLEVAFDPQSIGLAYYHLASIQWSLGNERTSQACYQLSVQAFPPLLPFVMQECQELLQEGEQSIELLNAQQIEQELTEHNIPLSPSERLSYLLYDCATASVDAEVFPVARDLMHVLEALTGDDVIRCMRQSLEREPDV